MKRTRTIATSLLGLTIASMNACGDASPVTAQSEPAGADTTQSGGADAIPGAQLAPAFPNLAFTRPAALTHAGDGSKRLFVVEQPGRIMVFDNDRNAESADVFLDIRSQVAVRHNEEGLLALAFHPDYARNGFFYVYYSTSEPRQGLLSRFSVSSDDPRRADPASETVILRADQPWGNHNGSTVLFGPDGYLYMSLGDGGAANDPNNAGQDLTTLLGKILRIDVDRSAGGNAYAVPADNPFIDRAGARPEIWAYGLRNVWRMSFDRETGDLWAGDVGQVRWEEIDIITRGGNYGWRIREGLHEFQAGVSVDPLIDPIVDHNRREAMSITGGYVYRGARYPQLRGVYVYGDYVTGRVWGIRAEGGRLVAHEELAAGGGRRKHISSFGEDADGELYVCAFDRLDGRGSSKGRIYRVVAD